MYTNIVVFFNNKPIWAQPIIGTNIVPSKLIFPHPVKKFYSKKRITTW